MRRIRLTRAIDLAGGPDSKGLIAVSRGQQQGQCEVVAQDAMAVDVVKFAGIQIKRIASDCFACVFKVHDLLKLDFPELSIDASQNIEDLSDRVFRKINESRSSEQFDNLCRQLGPYRLTSNVLSFGHFNLLA